MKNPHPYGFNMPDAGPSGLTPFLTSAIIIQAHPEAACTILGWQVSVLLPPA